MAWALKLLVPDRVTMPLPCLISTPPPEMPPAKLVLSVVPTVSVPPPSAIVPPPPERSPITWALPASAKVPAFTTRAVPEPRVSPEPNASVPASRVVPPVNDSAALSVRTAVPSWVRPPVPEIAVAMLLGPDWASSRAPSSRIPPLICDVSPVSFNVPELTVTPPESVSLPDRVNVPAPAWVTAPLPEIVPANVPFPV